MFEEQEDVDRLKRLVTHVDLLIYFRSLGFIEFRRLVMPWRSAVLMIFVKSHAQTLWHFNQRWGVRDPRICGMLPSLKWPLAV